MRKMYTFWVFTCLFVLWTSSMFAQKQTKTAVESAKNFVDIAPISDHYHHEYDAYFAEAYEQNPSIPKGLLEAIAFNTTRLKHIDPDNTIPSCIGLPKYYGVMGLVENGKNYFRNNLQTVAELSGITAKDIKESPRHSILAFAAAFAKTQAQQNINSKQIEDNISPLLALSELPLVDNVQDDFAMNSQLYGVLYFLSEDKFQKAYKIPSHEFDMQRIFGKENYKKVSAGQVDFTSVSQKNTTKKPPPHNGRFEATKPAVAEASHKGAACSMPNGPAEYSPALWTANDPSNYSSYTVSPYTIAIHTIQGTYSGAISWFQNPVANVSIHYVIRSFDGQVTQMACHDTRCWHVNTENSYSVGLEHDGWIDDGEVWYSNAMYHSSADLCQFIASDLGINLLQTYDGQPINGIQTLSHGCHKVKGHQSFANNTHTDPGDEWNWPFFYQLINPLPTPTTYTASSGTVYDSGGSGGNYGDEERTTYLIQPSGAATVTLTFNSYGVENGWDYLWIFDGTDDSGALIGKYSGTSPGTVTGTTGALFLEFRTDCATTDIGWSASYTSSTTPPTCVTPSGQTETNIHPLGAVLSWNGVPGYIEYEVTIKENLETTWKTYTTTTNSIELTGLEDNSFYEWRVRTNCGAGFYSGYAGSNFETPQVGLTLSSAGSYNTTLCTGTFTDSGGPSGYYANREDWTYTIAPTGANYVTLSFSFFNVENAYDYVYIYDGPTVTSNLIGSYTGTNSPGTIVSSGGSITIRFIADNATYEDGWEATWTCDQTTACQPSTIIDPLTNWQTADFNTDFIDTDACATGGIAKRFYQVMEWDGTEWRSNENNRYFNDEFGLGSIHSDWSQTAGTWSTNSNMYLHQSDQSAGNTNIHAAVTQDNSATYLFHWKANIDGTGSNRRAGIHFFADDPTASNLGNSYFVYFRVDNDKAQIYDVTGNSWSLETDDNVALNPNQMYDYKVTFDPVSGWIRGYVNDVLVTSWQDPTPHTSGTHVSLRTGNCDVLYDFMKVYKSRTTSELVTVGAANTNDVRVQSSFPSENVCRITSIFRDNAQSWSNLDTEDTKVDWTPPSNVAVNDGLGADVDNTNNSNQIEANWNNSTDTNSDVVAYWYSIGTSPGATDVLGWTNNGMNTSVTHTGLTLSSTQTYYVCVQVENGAGLFSTPQCSDGVSACLPGTAVTVANNWYTTDFTASFTDNDCSAGVKHGFHLVSDFDGSEWRANGQAGFFFEEVTTGSIHPDWTSAVGTWSVNGGAIYQSDQSQGNTNLHATVMQNSSFVYMYEWDANMDGSGSNRRSGLHFFCDDPTQSNRGNSYFVWWRVDSDKLQIYRVTNDVFSLEKETIITVDPNVWYNNKVTYDPSTGTIEVYRDDILIDTWTDPNPLTSGTAISLRNGDSQVWYDNIKVYQSRNTTANVSVGPVAVDAVRYQSPTPTTDVGKVYSIFLNNNNNWSLSAVSSLFKVDWTAPSDVLTVNDGTGADINIIPNPTEIEANWTASSDPHSNVVAYWYAIGTTPLATDVVNWTNNGTSTSVTHTALSLASGQWYYVSVRAENGVGLLSNPISSDGQQISVPCSIPGNVNLANVTTTSVDVSWANVTNVATYELRYRPTSGGTWTTLTLNNSTTSTSITGLNACTEYEIQMQTDCSSSNSGFGNSTIITTPTPTVSSVNMGTVSTTSASISWASSSGASDYEIQYQVAGSGSWNTLNLGSTGTSYNLTGLSPCTNYEVQVQALCNGTGSGYSSLQSFSTGIGAVASNSISNIANNSADISWAAVSGVTGYEVRYREVGTATWTSVPLGAATTNFLLGGLNSCTNYEVQTQGLCNGTGSGFTTSSTFTTNITSIASVTASNVNTNSADVSWTGGNNATSYDIRYREVGTTSWTTTTASSGSSTSNLTGLSACTTYEVQVQAVCGGSSSSGFSNSSNFSTNGGSVSTNNVSNVTANSVDVAWLSVSGVTGYEVRYRIIGTSSWTTTTLSATTTYTINGLASCSDYEVQVQAICNGAGSGFSASSTFTTDISSVASVNVSNVSTNSADVSWTGSNNATSYDIRYREVGTTSWTTTTASSGSSTSNLTGLSACTSYEVQIQAVCGGTNSGFSSSSNFNTGGGSVSTNNVSNVTASSVDVSWSSVSGVTDYEVRYREVGTSSWTNATISATNYTINGLAPCSDYEVQVQAICNGSGSGFTASSTFSTSISAIPASLAANNVTASTTNISWSSVSGVTGYEIRYQEVGSSTWTTVTVGSTVTSTSLSALNGCTDYEVQIQALCGGTGSGFSNSSTFTTAIATINSLTFLNVDYTSATVDWVGLGNATDYEIRYRTSGSSTWMNMVLGSTVTTANLTGLNGCTSYDVEVQAFCNTTGGGFSSSFQFTTTAPSATWNPISLQECSPTFDLNTLVTGNAGGNWSGGAYVSTSGLFTPTALAAGNYSVTYTVGSGSCQDSETLNVVVNNCTGGLAVGLKVFLEGVYNSSTGLMNTNLTSQIPMAQPFNVAPWNYTGNESLSSIPTNAVDWVLVELRDANNNQVVLETRPALLLSNGDVQDVTGSLGVKFYNVISGNYQVVIRHRNHLAVMSSNAVTVPTVANLDFTNPSNILSGNKQVAQLNGSLHGLYAGDINADGVITLFDYNFYTQELSSTATYVDSDCNLDSNTTVSDFNAYRPNASIIGIPQIRY